MSATAALGVHDPRSTGIARYVDRLGAALRGAGVDYRPCRAPRGDGALHFHLGNSSRRVAVQAPAGGRPYLLTVHDVVPRTPGLAPLYRALVYPLAARRAARVVVHSAYAASLLERVAGVGGERVRVVPHPAPRPAFEDAAAAREHLGIPDGPPLFVLPGVVKAAKLPRQALAAAAPLLRRGRIRLLLAGRIADAAAAREARELGVEILDAPGDRDYDAAVCAADVVLVLRAGSVGESNGPLLDALGAGRTVIASPVGSIPEVAGGAARLVEPAVRPLRDAMVELLDPQVRTAHAARAARRGRELTWAAAAAAHRPLLEEVAR